MQSDWYNRLHLLYNQRLYYLLLPNYTVAKNFASHAFSLFWYISSSRKSFAISLLNFYFFYSFWSLSQDSLLQISYTLITLQQILINILRCLSIRLVESVDNIYIVRYKSRKSVDILRESLSIYREIKNKIVQRVSILIYRLYNIYYNKDVFQTTIYVSKTLIQSIFSGFNYYIIFDIEYVSIVVSKRYWLSSEKHFRVLINW